MEENRRLQESLNENLGNSGFPHNIRVKVSERLRGALFEKHREGIKHV